MSENIYNILIKLGSLCIRKKESVSSVHKHNNNVQGGQFLSYHGVEMEGKIIANCFIIVSRMVSMVTRFHTKKLKHFIVQTFRYSEVFKPVATRTNCQQFKHRNQYKQVTKSGHILDSFVLFGLFYYSFILFYFKLKI